MLKGTLDDFTLPDIFRLMSLAKKTGRLDVGRQAGTGTVFFREGEVYYAESSLSKEPLGRKLVRARALTESQLNKALDQHAETGQRVGEILVRSGMVSADQIEVAVQEQIEDAVFDLLRWDLGDFSWNDGVELVVEVPIAVSVENLIVEAARRLDELEVIKRKIPSTLAVLTMAAAPPEGAAEINITPDEWRVLVLVDGRRTVEEIGAMSRLDEFDAMRMLYGLLSAGLIEVDQDATAAAVMAADERETADALDEPIEEPAEAVAEADVDAEPETEVDAAPERIAVDEPEPEPEAVESEVVADYEVEADGEILEPAAPMEFEEVADEVADFEALTAVSEDAADEPAPAHAEPTLEVVAEDDAIDEPVAAPDATVRSDAETEGSLAAELSGVGEPPAEWFEDPQPAASTVEPQSDAFLDDFLADELFGDAAEAAPAETTPDERPAGEAPAPPAPAPEFEAPAASDETEPVAEAPAAPELETPPAPAQGDDALNVDRATAVRELAGLFDDDRPRPTKSAAPAAEDRPDEPADNRKRVEDDEQINKGLVARLIKGVKGL